MITKQDKLRRLYKEIEIYNSILETLDVLTFKPNANFIKTKHTIRVDRMIVAYELTLTNDEKADLIQYIREDVIGRKNNYIDANNRITMNDKHHTVIFIVN